MFEIIFGCWRADTLPVLLQVPCWKCDRAISLYHSRLQRLYVSKHCQESLIPAATNWLICRFKLLSSHLTTPASDGHRSWRALNVGVQMLCSVTRCIRISSHLISAVDRGGLRLSYPSLRDLPSHVEYIMLVSVYAFCIFALLSITGLSHFVCKEYTVTKYKMH